MASKKKLTNSADEASLSALLSGEAVFVIPYFQRPYKWTPKRLKQLEDDILRLVDDAEDNHFLGAVIIHGRPSNPADPDVYEVIDGQQRITTIYIYLCAVVKVLSNFKEYEEAASLFLKYLVINRQISLTTNAKLQSSKDNRKQLNRVINDVLEDTELHAKLQSFEFKPIPAVGSDSGHLYTNYKAALKFLSSQAKQENIDRIRAIYKALLERMSVVQIDVTDPTNGPKIFDSLNSRQEPMTTGDLVRNEIFRKVADQEPTVVESLDQQFWQPFYEKFKVNNTSLFDQYFFPFGLTKNPNLKKSDVYPYLRNHWVQEKQPAQIINDLATYQNSFLDLANGTNLLMNSAQVAAAVKRISEIIPTSTYPFLMQVLNGLKDESLTEKTGLAVLSVVESFLVRRAICGHEPTGLHSVFKGLWAECEGKPTAELVEIKIRERKTVVWPSTDDVKECARKRPLYGSSITKFVLIEWNRSLGGDQPNTLPWIEHILPTALSEAWKQDFSEKQHLEYKDRLANLLPLSQEMNQGLGNAPYTTKRVLYMEDAMFKAARQFAIENESWGVPQLEARAELLADWVVSRWP